MSVGFSNLSTVVDGEATTFFSRQIEEGSHLALEKSGFVLFSLLSTQQKELCFGRIFPIIAILYL